MYTFKQLKEFIEKHDYFLLTSHWPHITIGFNSKMYSKIAKTIPESENETKSPWLNLRPCNISEYIQHKRPILEEIKCATPTNP